MNELLYSKHQCIMTRGKTQNTFSTSEPLSALCNHFFFFERESWRGGTEGKKEKILSRLHALLGAQHGAQPDAPSHKIMT